MAKKLKECPDCGEDANKEEIEFNGVCKECQIETIASRSRD